MELACAICHDRFNERERVPRVLTCGHTFCQRCLVDLKKCNILLCPTCRQYFTPDIKSLTKNFVILDNLVYAERIHTAQAEQQIAEKEY